MDVVKDTYHVRHTTYRVREYQGKNGKETQAKSAEWGRHFLPSFIFFAGRRRTAGFVQQLLPLHLHHGSRTCQERELRWSEGRC